MVEDCSVPWLVGGDFNVILNDSEKLRGLPVSQMETADFAQCVSNSGLKELTFSRSMYTWWNGRTSDDSIFERLDRVFCKEIFWSECHQSEVTYLIREIRWIRPCSITCGM